MRYKEEYKDDIIQIVKNFYNESLKEYGLEFSLPALLKTIERTKDNSYVLVKDKPQGVIAGQPALTPLGERVWQEIIWYVNKPYRRYGVRFLKEVEQDLKKQGYKSMTMICMHNLKTEKLFNFYQRIGFKPIETHFIKEL